MTEFTSPGVSVGDRDGDLDRRVREAQTELLYRRSQMVNWAGAGFALLLAMGLLPYLPAAGVWAWVALRFLVSAARLVLNLQYRASDDQGRPFWDHAFVAGLCVDGFAWAVIGLWVVPLDLPTISVLMLTAIVGVASVGIFVLQSSFRASATFVVSMLVPLVLLALWMGDRSGRFVGAGLSIYIVLLLIETRYSERRIHELLRLRFVTDRIAE